MERKMRTGENGVFHRHRSSGQLVSVVDVVSVNNGVENENDAKQSSTPDDHEETFQLPQSTHSLLFTEKICSLPFGVALSVFFISISCLILALFDNMSGGSPGNPLNVPSNVPPEVRAAQYISILIALIMEEEIPTALYYLRMLDRGAVQEKMKGNYSRFIMSNMCRLLIGMLFLLNVFLVLAQSRHVLEMFYDILALNFVSMIDDIAFQLAKLDILGNRLQTAASSKCFRVEFEKKPYFFRKKITIFSKFVYVFNLILFLAGMITITTLQKSGFFLCNSVTLEFGDDIWQRAWVEKSPGQYDTSVLVYSYFNGVYKQDGVYAGRPVYREMRKSDFSPFETKIGASIFYCPDEGSFVFSHQDISKAKPSGEKKTPCQDWLLKSPSTKSYDLMELNGDWSIWKGVISHNAHLSVTCNECHEDTDCNLNGVCIDTKCSCTNDNYYGLHCELEQPCPRLTGQFNDTWSLLYNQQCKHMMEYSRPVYVLQSMPSYFKLNNGVTTINEDDIVLLEFTGSRWVGIKIKQGITMLDNEELLLRELEFHAFWQHAFDNETIIISDPTMGSDPLEVDFYKIGERVEGSGPFGVLHPLQDPRGSGMIRCDRSVTAENAGYSNIHTHCNKNSTISSGETDK